MIQTQTLAKEFAMSPWRLAFGLSWVGVLIGLQVWQVVAKRDDWPLSSYPMYSGLQRGTVTRQELRAVAASGELSFTADQIEPLSPRTVSMVLRHADAKHASSVRRAIFDRYYERRALGEHNGPLLSSLRQYQYTWQIRPDLSNVDKPRLTLLQTIPAFEPQLMDALSLQSRGKGQASAPISAGEGAVIINLATGTMGGGAHASPDEFAANGAAVEFPQGVATAHVEASPSAYVDATFRAPAGRYQLWLRGKGKNAKQDSVWVQFDAEIGTEKTKFDGGIGQFRETYPPSAFGWASATPLGKPETITLRGDEPHVVRVSVREGGVVVDQIVLSRAWLENPGEMGPAL
jgi:hypothetical protein